MHTYSQIYQIIIANSEQTETWRKSTLIVP